MRSLGVKPGKTIDHTCKTGEQRQLMVGEDFSVDSSTTPPIHRLYLVKDHVNKVIEAGIYKLSMTK